MERLYFAFCMRMNGSNTFVIWYQAESDGFLRKPDNRLVAAFSIECLADAASRIGVTLAADQIIDYDFDRLRVWCQHPSAENVECPAFLDAWNCFDDLAGLRLNPDSAYAKLSRNAGPTYDKLFWGNNLPSVTPPGELFTPSWEADELETIRQVMEAGLALVEAELRM